MKFGKALGAFFILTIVFVLSVYAYAEDRLHSSTRFLDRDLLAETALKDEVQAVREAEQGKDLAWEALQVAEAKLVDAEASGDPDAIEAATRERDEAKEALDLAESRLNEAISAQEIETVRVHEALERMSDPQVTAMNRKLNNARHNRFGVDLDAEHLEAVVEGNYNDRQITALTKALEEEAKFKAHADRFLARYEATGKEEFRDKAERFESRGATQKEKFLSKIDRFNDKDSVSCPREEESEGTGEAKAVRPVHDIKDLKGNVRHESREMARNSARESARKLARESFRENSRDEKRKANRGQGKGQEK